MMNFRDDGLDAILASLRAKGDRVDERIQETAEGASGGSPTPKVNRVELWQPPA